MHASLLSQVVQMPEKHLHEWPRRHAHTPSAGCGCHWSEKWHWCDAWRYRDVFTHSLTRKAGPWHGTSRLAWMLFRAPRTLFPLCPETMTSDSLPLAPVTPRLLSLWPQQLLPLHDCPQAAVSLGFPPKPSPLPFTSTYSQAFNLTSKLTSPKPAS